MLKDLLSESAKQLIKDFRDKCSKLGIKKWNKNLYAVEKEAEEAIPSAFALGVEEARRKDYCQTHYKKGFEDGEQSGIQKACADCDPKDEHIIPEDRSTTRISRPCNGCTKHQTIAGALLKSEYWKSWYDHASKNRLYDVDETLTVDAMSDEHFDEFMKFALQSNLTTHNP